MTSWAIFLHIRNTNLVTVLAIGNILVLDSVAGIADHAGHHWSRHDDHRVFHDGHRLACNAGDPVGFLLVKDGVYHTYCADGRRVYYGDYQDDSSCV